MGAFQRWMDKQDTSCCPDPDPDYIDALDMADAFEPESVPDAISSHGFEDRTTPVDTLMAGPLSMHLDYADQLWGG